MTSVQACFVKAVTVRWQKDGRENANAKEHFTGHSGGNELQIKHTCYEHLLWQSWRTGNECV